MKGKRLFWAAIIVVELVLVYLLWKPTQARFGKQAHRTPTAVTQPVENETAANTPPKAPAVAESPRAPSALLPPMRVPAPDARRAVPPATAATAARHPNPPAANSSVIAMAHKPSPIPHVAPRTRRMPPAVNAGLISRVPVPEKKLSTPPLSPLDSFWCQMSNIDSNCNCKGNEERAGNGPLQ